jgi:hypothetical protein
MKIETAELMRVSQGFSLHGIRWGAVISGMSVGIGLYILFMLLAACVSLACAAAGVGSDADAQGAVLIWNLAGALAASMAGGSVAARAADLRRHADGVMHGLVVWGATILLALLLAVLALREMTGGALILMAQQAEQTALGPSSREDPAPWRSRAAPVARNIPAWPNQFSGSARHVDRDWIQNAVATEVREGRPMDTSMYAVLLICASAAMSLFGGIAGGVLGTQRPRRPDPLDHANWRDEIDLLDR